MTSTQRFFLVFATLLAVTSTVAAVWLMGRTPVTDLSRFSQGKTTQKANQTAAEKARKDMGRASLATSATSTMTLADGLAPAPLAASVSGHHKPSTDAAAPTMVAKTSR